MTSPRTELELLYRSGDDRQRCRLRPGRYSIGSAPDCDVVIDDPTVEARHARIAYADGRWVLTPESEGAPIVVRGDRVPYAVVSSVTQAVLGSARVTLLPRVSTAVSSAVAVEDVDTLLHTVISGGRPRGIEPAGDTLRYLRLLRNATNALLSGDSVDVLLEQIMDLVFEELQAERGLLLVGTEDPATLEPKVTRARPGLSAAHIKVSQSIAETALRSRQALLVEDALEDERFRSAASIADLGIRSAMCAPLAYDNRVSGLVFVDRTSQPYGQSDLAVLSILSGLSAAALERAALQSRVADERRMRDRLSRYHAPAIVDDILERADSGAVDLHASERTITVLFADLVGFTTLAERLAPSRVVEVLNLVFGEVSEEVFAHEGTLDKFLGDGVMVFFGAPCEQPDHAARAVRAARGMQERIAGLRRRGGDLAELALRVGIESGNAIVGDLGTSMRKDYTVVGDTVNVASRLESAVAASGEIVIGPNAHAAVDGEFRCTELAATQLRGKAEPIRSWRVDG